MPEPFFPNFLHNPADYAAAEQFWKKLWREVVGTTPLAGPWHEPWLTTIYLEGTPFPDGDPIFSAISQDHRLGLRVIQHEPAGHDVDFHPWETTFGDGPTPTRVLVIDCALFPDAAHLATAAMRNWVSTGTCEACADSASDGHQVPVAIPIRGTEK